MKRIEPYTGFEQGPIRPPSEAESLLIRITRNCPWNRCTFCPVYKGSSFSLRPLDHVIKDVDMIRFYVQAIIEAQDTKRPISQKELFALSPEGDRGDRQALYAAYNFVVSGMKSIFLQDGNSLIIKPDDIVSILKHLQQSFPQVQRVTSYARSHTIARLSDDNLKRMADAGLNRIHIGMESGSDKVLTMVKKGSDKATQILAGQKVKRAGIQLSEYYMPGLGGLQLFQESARETADAMNQINPDFIRLRTLALPAGTPLTEQYEAGKFEKMGEVDVARELLLFIESLQGISSTVKSDHVLNLFQEVEGILPNDKPKMTAPITSFLELSPKEQMIFCIGRRTHCLSKLDDLTNPLLRNHALHACAEFGATVENMDTVIDSIIKRFI
ncbi:MAG: radical SAM protein [Desulfobacterales bacterium]|nr:radical SAM protein [Deltaproteobacteria bacterium]NNK96009.1 radical SAM protein [Desulfobacterales bacterium]